MGVSGGMEGEDEVRVNGAVEVAEVVAEGDLASGGEAAAAGGSDQAVVVVAVAAEGTTAKVRGSRDSCDGECGGIRC